MELLAPIVAVTVHPERARITRRGRAAVGAGAAELVVADLPTTLLDESVRVAGRSAAAARVLGVDVRWRTFVLLGIVIAPLAVGAAVMPLAR